MLTKKALCLLAAGLIAAPTVQASFSGIEALVSLARFQSSGSRKVQAFECNICGEGNSITIPGAVIPNPITGEILLCGEAGAASHSHLREV